MSISYRGIAAAGLLLGTLPALAQTAAAQTAGVQTAGDRSVETASASAAVETAPTMGRVTGLPLPRFVSFRSNAVNLRKGPGKKYKIEWSYRRAGLPVEVIQEYDRWRRVRDADGTEGWVLHSLLTRRRTGLVEGVEPVGARVRPSADERLVARLEPGVVVALRSCQAKWCRVDVNGHTGFVPKASLYGVYRSETLGD